jgi:hypothetical protein
MNLLTYALLMLHTLPPAYADIDEPNRHERLETIAMACTQAVQLATCTGPYEQKKTCEIKWNYDQYDLLALIVTKGWWESRFALNVHQGNCRSYECDPIKMRTTGKIVHLARTPWQFQRTAYSETYWDKMVGTDLESTRLAAYTAAIILSRGRDACKSEQGAIVWYGRGRCRSDSRHLLNRYHTFTRMKALRDTRTSQN